MTENKPGYRGGNLYGANFEERLYPTGDLVVDNLSPSAVAEKILWKIEVLRDSRLLV